MSKAISIGYLFKVSAGNVNASHTEGNVMVAKKVTLPDGSAIPYISGQALRRMLRDRLEDLGWRLSEPFCQVSGQEVTPPVRPWEFIDEDLFGYLDPSGGRRRTSPVRVSAAIGLFPYQGDRDLGTRSFEKFGQAMSEGGNMFEIEIYANLFRGAILIELDRIGVWKTRYELIQPSSKDNPNAKEKEEKEREKNLVENLKNQELRYESLQNGLSISLPSTQKIERVEALFDALGLLWGGGRTARMLTDLSPRFLAYARLKVKHPVFLENLEAKFEKGKYRLELKPLINALERFKDQTEKVIFGLEAGFLANEEEIHNELGHLGEVKPLGEAFQAIKEDLKEIWKDSQ